MTTQQDLEDRMEKLIAQGLLTPALVRETGRAFKQAVAESSPPAQLENQPK